MGRVRHVLRNVPSLYQLSVSETGVAVDSNSYVYTPASGTGFIQQPLINSHFNSDEPGGDGSDPGFLFTDNFSRRYADNHIEYWWYKQNYDDAATLGIGSVAWIEQTAGWAGNIYHGITNGGTAGPGTGYKGRGQAASSANLTGQQGGQMADHDFFGGQAYPEVWFRYYIQPQSDYDGGHEKMLDFTTSGLASGVILALAYNYFGNEEIQMLPYRFQDFGLNPPGPGNTSWIGSNQAPSVTLIPTHWYYIEYHVKLNTPGSFNGIYEFWMDDLGINGLTIPTNPTLRGRHTGVKFRGAGDNDLITGNWIENWANPGSNGTLYYDYAAARSDHACGFIP